MRKRIGLILGSGRSGTTLLRSILNSSEHAFCVPETSFYSRFWSARHLIFILCIIFRLDFKLFILWLVFNRSHDPSMKNFKLNHEDYRKYGFNKLSNLDFFSLGFINLLKLIASKGNKDGINYIFEKTPDNILYINNFISLIEYDAVLNIRRNPLDIISSTINRGDLENNIYRPLAKILVGLKNIDQLGDFDNFKIHITSYEDLTNNSEESIFKICENINIPYSEDMLVPKNTQSSSSYGKIGSRGIKKSKSNFNETLSTYSQKIIKNSYPNSTYFERTEPDFNLQLILRKLRLKSAIAFLNIEILFGRYGLRPFRALLSLKTFKEFKKWSKKKT